MIARFTRRGWGWTMVAVALAVALGCAAMTDAVSAKPPPAAAAPSTQPAPGAPMQFMMPPGAPSTPAMPGPTMPPAAAASPRPAVRSVPGVIESAEVVAEKEKQAAETYAKLQRRLPTLRVDNASFANVLDLLREYGQVNLEVNWRALEAAGLERNAPVTMQLTDVPLEQALQYLLRNVGTGAGARLDYAVEGNVVIVSTDEDLSQHVVIRVYDVSDLLSASATAQPAGYGPMGGFLPPGMVGQPGNRPPNSLVALITETIAPDTWRDHGGTIGSINSFGDKLVVTQTPANHRTLTALLAALREQPAAPSTGPAPAK